MMEKKKLKITFMRGEDVDLDDLLELLSGEKHLKEILTIPHNLLYWPSGKRQQSQRAAILMQLGLRFIEENYGKEKPLKVDEDQSLPVAKTTSIDPFAAL